VDADVVALRACLAGPRAGDLQGLPRPAASRPDHVALVGGDVAAATAAVIAALAAPGAQAGELTAAQGESAAALREERYRDHAWHAGPWHDVTPGDVRSVLGA
jgi:hypothetical protein